MAEDGKLTRKALEGDVAVADDGDENELPVSSDIRTVVRRDEQFVNELAQEVTGKVNAVGNSVMYEGMLDGFPADMKSQVDGICQGNGRLVSVFLSIFTKYGLNGLKILLDLRAVYHEDGVRVIISDIEVIKGSMDIVLGFAKENGLSGEPVLALFQRLICSSQNRSLAGLLDLVNAQMYLMNKANDANCLNEALTFNWTYSELIVWVGNHRNLIQWRYMDVAKESLLAHLNLFDGSRRPRN